MGRVGFRVRAAVEADVPMVARLWQELDRLHATLFPSFFRQDATRAAERVHDCLRGAAESGYEALLVAVEEDEQVAGACHLQIYDTPAGATLMPERRAHLETLVVDVAKRRRGCGRALVGAAGAFAKERGACQLVLTVWAGNEEAERFYAALGYRVVNRVLGITL